MIIHVEQFDLSVEFELFTCQDEGDNIIYRLQTETLQSLTTVSH